MSKPLIILLTTVSLLLAACGGTTGGGACATTGTGTLVINISGLPTGVPADVSVSGPGGSQTVTETQSLALAGGSYTIVGAKVTQPDPIVRTVYSATVSTSPACVEDAQTTEVAVTYSPIASSNKVWIGGEQDDEMLGFASALLGASGNVSATVVADTDGSGGFTFDREGNLWVIGGTTADPALMRYPAADLGVSGDKAPDRKIDLAGVSCIPSVTALAFDAGGNLWLSVLCADKVVKLSAAQLATSGEVTPSVEISGIDAPEGLAFDASGNLWVATGADRMLRYDASRLGASTDAAPNLSLELKTPGPVIDTLGTNQLAFDASGNLWVAAFADNVIYRLSPGDQASSGSQTLTPAIQISLNVGALLEGIAFDESGGLWLAYSAGSFARLSPAQLEVSSTPGAPTVPETIISSPDLAYADSIALYPAPAALPLYHSLP